MCRLVILEQIVITARIGVLVIIDESALESEEGVEPVGNWAVLLLVAQVPLADERRPIAVVLQELRQRAAGRAQSLLARGPRGTKRHLDPHPLLIAPRYQRRSCGRAARRGIEISEPRAVLREAVDIRRLDVRRAVTADVAVADVVSDDEHDVRA